jgi:hypothetical protein
MQGTFAQHYAKKFIDCGVEAKAKGEKGLLSYMQTPSFPPSILTTDQLLFKEREACE